MPPTDGPQAYLNGRFIPAAEACLSVADAGFVLGVTIAEQLRTFAGRLFRLDAHLQRLAHSLQLIGIESPIDLSELGRVAEQLAASNARFLAEGDDLNLTIFVTPGPYPAMAAPAAHAGPTVCVHTFPLPFHLWSAKYTQGESLVTTDVEQVPASCWPRELKCRSRMHYYLADRQARLREPGARALMLDADGSITEATTANLVLYTPGQGLVGPPRAKVLPGVSLEALIGFARHAGLAYAERGLAPGDVAAAGEVLLTSTSLCVVPVVRFNGQPIGTGRPGPIHEMLLAAWSRAVGMDIATQAERFAAR